MTKTIDRPIEIEITPEMLEAGIQRLLEIGEASAFYLAREAFLAVVEVALHQGVLTLPRSRR